MPMRFDCPTCGKSLSAPEGKAGETVSCPGCQGRFRVPYSTSPPPPSVAPVASEPPAPPPPPVRESLTVARSAERPGADLPLAETAEWHYIVNGQQSGPAALTQLRELAAAGQIRPSDKVWKNGMPAWGDASSIPNLFPPRPASTSPPPPPPDLMTGRAAATTTTCYLVQGVNGQIKLRKNRLVISRKGVLGFLNHGLAGDKEIPLKNIKSVQFKQAGGIASGFLQLGISGSNEAKGGLFGATTDENTVVFTIAQQPQFEEVKRFIDSIIDEEAIDFDSLDLPREGQEGASGDRVGRPEEKPSLSNQPGIGTRGSVGPTSLAAEGNQNTSSASESPGILETIRRKLPTSAYKVTKIIKRGDIASGTIFQAFREKLEERGPVWDGGFGQRKIEVSVREADSMEVENLDNLIWWVGRGYRQVTATVSLKRQPDKITIIVDVNQGWSKWYALACLLALPCLCVGIAGWMGATGASLLFAKGKITGAVQKRLDELADETG